MIVNEIHSQEAAGAVSDVKNKKILLINDLCGYGKVALSAMIPILSYYGLQTFTLPTALVSNTLNYPDFTIQDTTAYLQKTLMIWKKLGFQFDAISTGFLVTEEQMKTISAFCKEQAAQDVLIFNDPIMGDNGSLYNGVPLKTVAYMRSLVSCAHVTMPNYTEACYLTEREPETSGNLSRTDALVLVDDLRKIGAKSIIITSCQIEGRPCVAGYDGSCNESFFLPYTQIPIYFPGTGDIFSSILIGGILQNHSLQRSTYRAMKLISRMLAEHQEQKDTKQGLPIEQCLANLDG